MGNVKINMGRAMALVNNACEAALWQIAEEDLKKELQKQFRATRPQSKQWGESVASSIEKKDPVISGTLVIGEVGFDEDTADYILHRAEVLDEGNHHTSGGVYSNPGGSVYDASFDDQHHSRAKTRYRIPQFEHDGQHAVENANANIQAKASTIKQKCEDFIVPYLMKALTNCIEG